MEILEIIDNDDGTCTMECEFSDEEVNILLNYAVNDILKKQLKKYKEAAVNE